MTIEKSELAQSWETASESFNEAWRILNTGHMLNTSAISSDYATTESLMNYTATAETVAEITARKLKAAETVTAMLPELARLDKLGARESYSRYKNAIHKAARDAEYAANYNPEKHNIKAIAELTVKRQTVEKSANRKLRLSNPFCHNYELARILAAGTNRTFENVWQEVEDYLRIHPMKYAVSTDTLKAA